MAQSRRAKLAYQCPLVAGMCCKTILRPGKSEAYFSKIKSRFRTEKALTGKSQRSSTNSAMLLRTSRLQTTPYWGCGYRDTKSKCAPDLLKPPFCAAFELGNRRRDARRPCGAGAIPPQPCRLVRRGPVMPAAAAQHDAHQVGGVLGGELRHDARAVSTPLTMPS